MTWYLATGDGPFYFAEAIRKLGWLPVIWRADEGFGTNHGFRLWYDYPLQLVIKILSSIGLPWWWIDKLLWFGAIGLALYASYTLGKYFIRKPYAYLVPAIYVLNTYFLLLFSGGQLGVAWAYAYMPFVLVQFIRAIDLNKEFILREAIRRGLALALLLLFDLRFAYLLLGVLALYFLLTRKVHKIFEFLISLLIALGIHAFWIVPTVLLGGAGVGGLENDITNPGILRFLSFADFPHALSLLHPNWPENLFGKVYFLQPEFLVIPVLAFASLLFIKLKTEGKPMTFFAVLALAGVFFAKGVQEPLGWVYAWMFAHIPGFVMFRDPTKFYVYIALSYSVLIPFTLEHMKKKAVPIVFLVFWILTLRAVFAGQVLGNFRPIQLPDEYVRLKNLLVEDTTPSRTLWIPRQEKFAYQSDIHPLLDSDQLFPNASVSAVTRIVKNPDFIAALADAGVRYVIVPQDSEKRMFLDDYRFDPVQRKDLVAALDKTPLRPSGGFKSIAVYENNRFVMQPRVPAGIPLQEQYTRIGLGISVFTLLVSILVLLQ